VAESIGLLVVEQNLGVAARSADRLLVMASARIEEEMQAAALLADEDAQRRELRRLPARRAVTAKSAAA
jgi:ABC-type branched-subunit amino acid transport system ATPase component